MNSTQRKFVRCFNCNSKPATVKCFDCNTDEPIKLCYHCDADIHHDLEHQKQIIPYDQMVDQTRSITPNKENHQSAPRSPQAHSRSDSQNLSSILRSKIKKNSEDVQNQSVINEDYMNIQKTQLKSVELKFRIKFQEQENTINLLKQHIENIEQKHKDNISKMREQVIKAQDEAYQKTEEAHSEVNKVRRIYEDKINGYVAQLESEAQFNNQLQIKLDDLRYYFYNFRLTHQNKVSELQQQISQLRADIERRKFQEEKLQIDCENQIIQAKQDLQKDFERQIQIIKQDSNQINDDCKQKVQHKQELINDLQNQIQQLQSTLRDVDVIWQKKLNYEQLQTEDIRNKYNMIKEECDLLHKENKHLQSEILIYQKENELFQKEKLNLTKQLNSISEKNEKLDRFIYGARKSKSRY